MSGHKFKKGELITILATHTHQTDSRYSGSLADARWYWAHYYGPSTTARDLALNARVKELISEDDYRATVGNTPTTRSGPVPSTRRSVTAEDIVKSALAKRSPLVHATVGDSRGAPVTADDILRAFSKRKKP